MAYRENVLNFDAMGNLTFILQNRVKGKESRRTNLLSYKSYMREKDPHTQTYMRVSAKLLCRSSPVFKAMLKLPLLEGSTLRRTGKVSIPLPDDDPVIFEVLMDIVHGRNRWSRVPRQVDLLFLTRLAILVDKYALREAVMPFVDGWFEGLAKDIPQSLTPDLIHWLCVSWVFRRPDEFNHVTRIMERESNGMDLDSYSIELKEDLPIPERVMDTILTHRTLGIQKAYSVLSRSISQLQSGSPRCTSTRHEPHRFTCDAVLLGSLLESSSKLGVWPPPEAPYYEITFKALVEGINEVNLTSFCTKMGFTGQTSGSHGMKQEIGAALGKVGRKVRGLELRDFD